MKKLGLSVVGIACLIVGITLVLAWWPEVVRLFQGVAGMALAVGGLVVLALIKE